MPGEVYAKGTKVPVERSKVEDPAIPSADACLQRSRAWRAAPASAWPNGETAFPRSN